MDRGDETAQIGVGLQQWVGADNSDLCLQALGCPHRASTRSSTGGSPCRRVQQLMGAANNAHLRGRASSAWPARQVLCSCSNPGCFSGCQLGRPPFWSTADVVLQEGGSEGRQGWAGEMKVFRVALIFDSGWVLIIGACACRLWGARVV